MYAYNGTHYHYEPPQLNKLSEYLPAEMDVFRFEASKPNQLPWLQSSAVGC